MVKYSQLSSVSWVNKTWVTGLLAFVLAINLMSAIKNGKGVPDNEIPLFWPMFVSIVVVALFIIYPYYHYRIMGGFVKRIPPRFVQEKPVFVQMYE